MIKKSYSILSKQSFHFNHLSRKKPFTALSPHLKHKKKPPVEPMVLTVAKSPYYRPGPKAPLNGFPFAPLLHADPKKITYFFLRIFLFCKQIIFFK